MYLSFYIKHDKVNCIHVHMQHWFVHVHSDLNAWLHIVFAQLHKSMLLWFQCLDESTCEANGRYHDTCMLGSGTSWNFDLPVYTSKWASPWRTLMLFTSLNYLTTWWCNIFARIYCNLAIHLLEPSLMTSFPSVYVVGIKHEWRWFVSSTPNYASFRAVKYVLRVFRGCKHMGWFENKVRTKI